MLGLVNTAVRCISLSIFSSSSEALMLETPKETISMPRSSRHFLLSTWLRMSASSIVWAGKLL